MANTPPIPTVAELEEEKPIPQEPTALRSRIAEEAGLTEEELASLKVFSSIDFFGNKWEIDHEPPGNPNLIVFALFVGDQAERIESDHLPGDVRVYLISKGARDPLSHSWFLFTLSRVSTTAPVTARMQLSTFVEEVAEEWRALAILVGLIDEDDEDDTPPEPELSS